MKVIKRNGSEVEFDRNKILLAITKSNNSVEEQNRMSNKDIENTVNRICRTCKSFDRACHVEEIQDIVEAELMKRNFYYVAKSYVRYRYDRERHRRLSHHG